MKEETFKVRFCERQFSNAIEKEKKRFEEVKRKKKEAKEQRKDRVKKQIQSWFQAQLDKFVTESGEQTNTRFLNEEIKLSNEEIREIIEATIKDLADQTGMQVTTINTSLPAKVVAELEFNPMGRKVLYRRQYRHSGYNYASTNHWITSVGYYPLK